MKVKRSLLAFFMLIIMILFSGCGKYYKHTFDYQTLSEKTVGVEICYLHNALYADRIYVLQKDEIPVFLEEFCGLSFCYTVPPRRPEKYTVKLLYNDGSMDYIGAYGGREFDERGEPVGFAPYLDYYSVKEYYDLLLKYIEIEREDVIFDSQLWGSPTEK